MRRKTAIWTLMMVASAVVGVAQEPAAQQSAPPSGQQNSAQEAHDALDKGVAAFRAGQYDEAATEFQKAKELDPTSINARLYLATTYAAEYIPGAPSEDNRQFAQRAIDEFKGVLALDPNNLSAIDGMGSMLFNMAARPPFNPDMLKESATYHQKHIQLRPEDPEPYYWIGVIDWTITFKANAELRAQYNQNHPASEIREDEPLPPDLRERYGQDYGPLIDDGIAKLQRAIELRPDHADAMAYLNLLFRRKADQVDNPDERAALEKQADDLVVKVKEIQERQAAETAPNQEEQQNPPSPSPAPPKSGRPMRIRIGGNVQRPRLISQTQPIYPTLARAARIQGTVVLDAIIRKDGSVGELRVISGHPLLVRAAEDAVQRWRYQPTLLNGEPVEVETTVTVTFELGAEPPASQPPPSN